MAHQIKAGIDSSVEEPADDAVSCIGGFNQRQGEALPPQIFLTLKFVVGIALKITEIVAPGVRL